MSAVDGECDDGQRKGEHDGEMELLNMRYWKKRPC